MQKKMLRLLSLLSCIFIVSCSSKEHPQTENEDLGEYDEELSYCDTCVLKLDAYRYEIKRGSKQINHLLTERQIRLLLSKSSFENLNRNPWRNALIFAEKNKKYHYTILHAYNSDGEDLIRGYTAAFFLKNPTIDSLLNLPNANVEDYFAIKSIYKNKKIELDKKCGHEMELAYKPEEFVNDDVQRQMRLCHWFKESRIVGNSDKILETYELFYSTYDTLGPFRSDREEKQRQENVKLENLIIHYFDNFFVHPTRNGRKKAVESWSLDTRKKRSTKLGFNLFLNDVFNYQHSLNRYLSDPKSRTAEFDSLFFSDYRYKYLQSLKNKKYLQSLRSEGFIVPKGYEKTTIEYEEDYKY